MPECSPAVQEAQRRLLELRRKRGVLSGFTPDDGRRPRGEAGAQGRGGAGETVTSRALHNAQRDLLAHRGERTTAAPQRQPIDDDHVLSRLLVRVPRSLLPNPLPKGEGVAPLLPFPSLVKLYPDIALAILRTKTSAPGRVWLLLRHADASGRGAVAQDEAARLLTGPGPLHICGRRQLANLLDQGEGRFWQRRAGTIWLRSAARVAAALGVARLGGSPVGVPLTALTGGIGDMRAHLYASFHSGRQRADLLTGKPRPASPVARATLTALSAAAPNSQRAYERRARVGRRAVVALGPPAGAVDEHEVAWRRGRALFHYRDHDGRHGRPGAVYLAWQLPNEYTGPHATLPRGRQKRLNRALADLFHDGMTGNGERSGDRRPTTDHRPRSEASRPLTADGQSPQSPQAQMQDGRQVGPATKAASSDAGRTMGVPARRFYGSAKSAALARHDRERYWRGREGIWYHQEEVRMTKDK